MSALATMPEMPAGFRPDPAPAMPSGFKPDAATELPQGFKLDTPDSGSAASIHAPQTDSAPPSATEEPGMFSRLLTHANKFGAGVVRGAYDFATLPEQLGEAGAKSVIKALGGPDVPSTFHDAPDMVLNALAPGYQQSIEGKVGQAVPGIGAAALTAGVGAGPVAAGQILGTIGAAQGVNSALQQNNASNASIPAQIGNVAGQGLLGYAAGRFLPSGVGKVGEATVGLPLAARIGAGLGAGAVEGGAVGAGQQVASNAISKATVSPDTSLTEGVGLAGGIGAATGSVLSPLAIRHGAEPAPEQSKPAPAPEAKPEPKPFDGGAIVRDPQTAHAIIQGNPDWKLGGVRLRDGSILVGPGLEPLGPAPDRRSFTTDKIPDATGAQSRQPAPPPPPGFKADPLPQQEPQVATKAQPGELSVNELSAAAKQRDEQGKATHLESVSEQQGVARAKDAIDLMKEERIRSYTPDRIGLMSTEKLRAAAEDLGVAYDSRSTTIPRIQDAVTLHLLDTRTDQQLYQKVREVADQNGLAGVKAGNRTDNINFLRDWYGNRAGNRQSNIPEKGAQNASPISSTTGLEKPEGKVPRQEGEGIARGENLQFNSQEASGPSSSGAREESSVNLPPLEGVANGGAGNTKATSDSGGGVPGGEQRLGDGSAPSVGRGQSVGAVDAALPKKSDLPFAGGGEAGGTARAKEFPKPLPPVAPTDAIGQRGVSEGPPGPLQIKSLLKKAVQPLSDDIRERFGKITAKYGADITNALTKVAAAPSTEADTLSTSFVRRAFGGDMNKAQEWTDLGRYYRLRELQARLGPNVGKGLPVLTPAEVASREADPVLQKATALYNKELAPLITDIRQRNGMLMNSAASDPKKFPFFLNLPGEYEGPQNTNTRVNPNFAFNEPASGNNQLLMDPKESLASALRGHLATDYKQQLVKTIKSSYTVPQASVVPAGRNSYQANFRGEKTDVVPIDLAAKGAPTMDVQYVPKQIAHEYNNIHQERGQFDTLFDRAIQAGTKAAVIGDFSPHAARVVAHVAARLAQSGKNIAGALPSWLGSNQAAIARMWQMKQTPMGEAVQLLLDRSGSDKGQGFDVKPGQTRIQQWLAKPHDLLFNPEHGVDPMGRRVIADAYMRNHFGHAFMDTVEKNLASGQMAPAEAANMLEKRLGDTGFLGLGRRVNNTMGFANKQTRSGLLNAASRVFPFISSESGMIPREIMKVANLDVPSTVSAFKRGDYKQAALMMAGQLATGAIGTYIAANGLNYANTKAQTGTGKFMWDNDEGHKLDLWMAPGWHLSNLDPTFSRATRMLGLKGVANDENLFKSVGTEAVNLPLETMAKTLKVAFSTALYAATKGQTGQGKWFDPYVSLDKQGNPTFLRDSGPLGAAGIPLVGNTARAWEKGGALGSAAIKDAASAIPGMQLKDQTNQSSKLQRIPTPDKLKRLRQGG